MNKENCLHYNTCVRHNPYCICSEDCPDQLYNLPPDNILIKILRRINEVEDSIPSFTYQENNVAKDLYDTLIEIKKIIKKR